MDKIKYKQFEKDVSSLYKSFREAYKEKKFTKALEIANTLDQKMYEKRLDLLELCKKK